MSYLKFNHFMILSCILFLHSLNTFAQSQIESAQNRYSIIDKKAAPFNTHLFNTTQTIPSTLTTEPTGTLLLNDLKQNASKKLLLEKFKNNSRGGSSDGGGFVSENSSILLNTVSKGLAEILKRSSPQILKNLSISVTKDQLILIVENIRSRPLDREWRDGKELMFNFGQDEAGPYIEVLEPFFAVYGATPVKFLSADKMKDIVLDLQLKMLHEAAHLWDLNENDSEKFGMDILKAIERDLIYCSDVRSEWVIHRGKGKVWTGWAYFNPNGSTFSNRLFKDYTSIKSQGIEVGDLENRIKNSSSEDVIRSASVTNLSMSKLKAHAKESGTLELEIEWLDHPNGKTSYNAKNTSGESLTCEDVY